MTESTIDLTPRSIRKVAAGLLLICVLPLVAAAGDTVQNRVVAGKVQTILLEARSGSDEDASTVARAAGRLAGLGDPAIAVLFATMKKDRLPLPVTEGEPAPRLDGRYRRIILAAMGNFPRERVIPFLRRQLRLDGGRNTRVNALRVLGAVGKARDLEYVISVASPEGRLLTGRVRRVMTSAMARIMQRDPAAFRVAERLLLAPRPVASGAVVRALGTAGGAPEVWMLVRYLDRASDNETAILSSISQIGQRVLRPHDSRVLEPIRDLLSSDDPQLVREAVLACGRLEDCDAVEPLIQRLGHEDESVQLMAHWALKKISGMSFAARPRTWTTWLKLENEWFEKRAPDLLEKLELDDPAAVGAALRELSVRRFRRDRLASAIVPVLEHPNSRVRILACQALKQLRTTVGVLPLIEALDDGDTRVQEQALVALRALTGRDLPQDSMAWRTVYEDDPRPAALVPRP